MISMGTRKDWVSVCKHCGKGGRTDSTTTGYAPSMTPAETHTSSCPESKDSKHIFIWKEQK